MGEILHSLWHRNIQLAKESNVDLLTECFNRRGWLNAVHPMAYLANRNNDTIGVLLLDLDHFKKVNDRFGHSVGDEVLARTSKAISGALRRSDIVGRWGGEEFIIFLHNLPSGKADDVAEKVRRAVEASGKEGQRGTCSIGAVVGRLSEDAIGDLENLIERADSSLFNAKDSGRNCVVIAGAGDSSDAAR